MRMIHCTKCQKNEAANTGRKFCGYCGGRMVTTAAVETLVDLMADMPTRYKNTFGTWKVTTEGDVEGRSTTDLGVHTGHIDEIAQSLGARCFYSLRFSPFSPTPAPAEPEDKKPVRQVSILLDIASETWDMSREERAQVLAEIFKTRPISVLQGQYYASVVLDFGSS